MKRFIITMILLYSSQVFSMGSLSDDTSSYMISSLKMWNSALQNHQDTVESNINNDQSTADLSFYRPDDSSEQWAVSTHTVSSEFEIRIIAMQNIGPLDGELPNRSQFVLKPYAANSNPITSTGSNPATPDPGQTVASWTCTISEVSDNAFPFSAGTQSKTTLFVMAGGFFSPCTSL